MSRNWTRSARLAVSLVLLGACASGAPSPSSAALTTTTATTATTATTSSASSTADERPCRGEAVAAVEHVIWIWMENHRAGAVLGNADAPVANQFANACASSASYRAVGSPSLPNYLGATAGDTFGVTDDAPPSSHALTGDNIFRQVRASGRASRSYEETMPGPCARTSSGRYAVKHNPAAYYAGGDDAEACVRDDVPLGDAHTGVLASDLANDTLPAFAFVTPDLCNDTHDCAVAVGDQWLGEWLPAILSSPAYARGDTVVFVVWDEPTPMPLVVIGPSIVAGTVLSGPFDHYSLLRTTEELLRLPLLGHAGDAPSMRPSLVH